MTDAAMQSSALRVASAAIHKEATWLLQRYHSLTAAEHALVREKIDAISERLWLEAGPFAAGTTQPQQEGAS